MSAERPAAREPLPEACACESCQDAAWPQTKGHDAASKMRFRVERTEYAEIEVDVAGLLAEWEPTKPRDEDETIEEYVQEALYEIGAQDLMWSGDFIEVLDKDTDESIRSEAVL